MQQHQEQQPDPMQERRHAAAPLTLQQLLGCIARCHACGRPRHSPVTPTSYPAPPLAPVGRQEAVHAHGSAVQYNCVLLASPEMHAVAGQCLEASVCEVFQVERRGWVEHAVLTATMACAEMADKRVCGVSKFRRVCACLCVSGGWAGVQGSGSGWAG